MRDARELEKAIGIEFENKALLEQVFIHRSYLNETNDNSIKSNERLEFLGDAALELVVTEFLFKKFMNKPEGELTSIRSAVVRRDHLAAVAKVLDLGEYLYLSKGETMSGGSEKDYILANTVEALLGAIYLDKGYVAVKELIMKYILPDIEKIIAEERHIDGKSKLQEVAQEELGITPHYELIEETGPDHDKEFRMAVLVGKQKIGEGQGTSKRKAEENAALDALENEDWKEATSN